VVEFGELDQDDADPGEAGEIVGADASEPDDTSALACSIDLSDQLEQLEQRLEEVEPDATEPPLQKQGPIESVAAELAPAEERETPPDTSANPFDETFEQEEMVVDRYASIQATQACDTPEILKQREISWAVQTIFEDAPLTDATHPAETQSAGLEPVATDPVVSTGEVDHEIDDQQSTVPFQVSADPVEELSSPIAVEQSAEQLGSGDAESTAMVPGDDEEPSGIDVPQKPCISLEAEHEDDPTTQIEVIRRPPPDDNDMIVVVDDQHGETPLRTAGGIAQRQEYRQLFSRLRQS
jgi:hypothetical protein